MHENLFKIVRQIGSLTENDIRLCTAYFEPVKFPKNTIIEPQGFIPQYLYFVVSGYVRLFHYSENGDEQTSHINCPPGFITSYFDFINQTKASNNVGCITDCTLLRITKDNLDRLNSQSKVATDFSIWVFQQSLAYNENRSIELATLSAEQRYMKLLDKYPALLLNVPLQQIASFLGMNSKSLSRIRKQIIR